MLKPDPLGARLHTGSDIPAEGFNPQRRINSLAHSQNPRVEGDRGRFRGRSGDQGTALLELGGASPQPPHSLKPGPRTPSTGLARGRTERPVAWSISGLPGSLRGAWRKPRSYLWERRCGAAAATPWKPQGCPRTAARRQEDRLRREPRPRPPSRDAGVELGCERAAGRLEARRSSGAPRGASVASEGAGLACVGENCRRIPRGQRRSFPAPLA